MGTVEESIDIEASPELVFSYLADLSTHTRWNSGLLKVDPVVKLTAGQKYSSEYMQVGRVLKAENEVTTLVPNDRLTIVNQTGPLKYEVSYSVKPTTQSSKLTYRANITSNISIFGLAEEVIGHVVSVKLRNDLESLKNLIEATHKES